MYKVICLLAMFYAALQIHDHQDKTIFDGQVEDSKLSLKH
jgi:hypothetical protein